MGVKNLPLIAERLAAAGRDPAEPAAAIERGTQAGQRTVDRDPRRAPRRGRRGGARGARDPALRPRRRPPRGDRLARAPPAARAAGWSSPAPAPRRAAWRRPCARSAPRWSSCRRSGSSRGSTTDEVRDAVADLHTYALVCLTSPNGVAAAVRGDGRRRAATPARSPTPRVAAIGPGTAAALARARRDRRRRPGALRRRGAGRGARRGRRRGPPGARRPRRRGARRAPRRARRARRRGRRRGALRDRARGPRPGGGRGGAGGRLRHLHLVLDRPQPARGGRRPLPALGPGRLDRPGDQRDRARARARGRTSRPSATTSTGWSRRCSPTPARRGSAWRPSTGACSGSERSVEGSG